MIQTSANWESTNLGALVTPESLRGVPDSSSELPFIGLEHVAPDSGRITGAGRSRDVRSLCPLVRAGDVLYGRLRPYLNKVTIAPFDAYASGEIIVLRPGRRLDARFLRWRLSAGDFVDYAVSKNAGDRPRVKWEQIAQFRIELPPVVEQRRIVDILETHSSRLDDGLVALTSASRKTVAFREAWMRAHLGINEGDGWPKIGDLLVSARGGWSRSRRHLVEPEAGTPYLKMNNITRDGDLSLEEVCSVAGSPEEVSRYQILPGDVLFNSKNSGDLLGKTAVATEALAGWTFNENIMRLRFDARVLHPEYVGMWFQSPVMRSRIRQAASASTNVSAIYMHHLRAMPMWVPPLESQRDLVAEFGAVAQAGKRLTSDCRLIGRRAELLRRALLDEAFSGRLTRQSSTLDRVEELTGV